MRRFAAAALLAASCIALAASGVRAQGCGRSVVVTVPGITWKDVHELRPPALMSLVQEGAIGSIAVRTNSARTTYASGFATIGAGARMDATVSAAQPAMRSEALMQHEVEIPAVDAIDEQAVGAGYTTVEPGALASALRDHAVITAAGNADPGRDVPSPAGTARFALLAAMDRSGQVAHAAIGDALLQDDPDAPFGVRADIPRVSEATARLLDTSSCAVAIVDTGDLIRADRLAAVEGGGGTSTRRAALLGVDRLLADLRDRLDLQRDLILVVSPTSPWSEEDVHFGIAVAAGRGFAGGSLLQSPSTRRPGLVSLPDIAPTLVDHVAAFVADPVEVPASMLGRPFFDVAAPQAERVENAIAFDAEAVFIDRIRTPVSTGFVLFQIALYLSTIWLLSRRERGDPSGYRRRLATVLEVAALALAAFPLSTYLAGVVDGHPMGTAAYVGVLLALDLVLVTIICLVLHGPLDRLLGVAATTLATFVVDLVIGAPLQLNTVFSYSPIVAGRFAGIGNLAFAVLAAAGVLTGALIVHRFRGSRAALAVTALLFAVTIVVDGAPQFGSDVGGALALTPGLALTLFLLAGRRPSPRVVLVSLLGAVAVLGAFLAVDLARPEESQTHLARFVQDIRQEGPQVFIDTITRKIRTNLRVARSTIWTFVVPPALAVVVWLLLYPRGRWQRLSRDHPSLRAGLLGGLILAVLGFAVNDSGIVVPAMMCSYLVPVALLAHLSMDAPRPRPA